jgi:hypothetical protein
MYEYTDFFIKAFRGAEEVPKFDVAQHVSHTVFPKLISKIPPKSSSPKVINISSLQNYQKYKIKQKRSTTLVFKWLSKGSKSVN